jgi:hypothetical protein
MGCGGGHSGFGRHAFSHGPDGNWFGSTKASDVVVLVLFVMYVLINVKW